MFFESFLYGKLTYGGMEQRLSLIVMLFFFTACTDTFEYSPYQSFDKDTPRGLNIQNLARLASAVNKDDTITIVFAGDAQRFYDELDAFVVSVNKLPSVDFVLLAGDVSDFGLLEEFELVHERLKKLDVPYITVAGNHDLLGRGDDLFTLIFGPLNFSFIYQGVKFVAHNTNSREYTTGNVPDLEWLGRELLPVDGVQHCVTLSHVAPFDPDFDRNLEGPYTALLRETPSLLVSLHGHAHQHMDITPYQDGVRYMTSHAFEDRSLVLLKIVQGELHKTEIRY